MEFQTAYNFNVVSAHHEIGRIRLELLHRSLPHTFIMVLLNYWIVSNTYVRGRSILIKLLMVREEGNVNIMYVINFLIVFGLILISSVVDV